MSSSTAEERIFKELSKSLRADMTHHILRTPFGEISVREEGNSITEVVVTGGLKEIPREIFRLPHLKGLFLKDNHIKRIPDEIAMLSELEALQLEGNEIGEISPQLTALCNLKYLEITFGLQVAPGDFPKGAQNVLDELRARGTTVHLHWLQPTTDESQEIGRAHV